MKKRNLTMVRKFKIIFTCLLVLGSLAANAQIDFETNNIPLPGGGEMDDETPPVPIDGFLTFGLIAGGAIGLRKFLKNSKK